MGCHFQKFNIKIWVSWNIFDYRHIILHDVLKNRNGVSVTSQVGFNGYAVNHCQTISDVFLANSKFCVENHINQGSKIKYYFITGINKTSGILPLQKSGQKIKK